jgi:hypothetical protein
MEMKMDLNTFLDRLLRAAQETVQVAREYVVDVLPDTYSFIIFPNKHGEGKELVGDAEVFPEDSLPRGQFIGPLDADGVVKYLWRGGKVPEWINVHVRAVEDGATVIQLICCGHFTSLPENFYNALADPDFESHTPFSIHGPFYPQGWKRGDPKFGLKDSPHFVF